ncbi:hypothetical protein AKJ16_DCAP12062 [Drosera capensis]
MGTCSFALSFTSSSFPNSPQTSKTTIDGDPFSTTTINDHHFLRPPYHPRLPPHNLLTITAYPTTATHSPPARKKSGERSSEDVMRTAAREKEAILQPSHKHLQPSNPNLCHLYRWRPELTECEDRVGGERKRGKMASCSRPLRPFQRGAVLPWIDEMPLGFDREKIFWHELRKAIKVMKTHL